MLPPKIIRPRIHVQERYPAIVSDRLFLNCREGGYGSVEPSLRGVAFLMGEAGNRGQNVRFREVAPSW